MEHLPNADTLRHLSKGQLLKVDAFTAGTSQTYYFVPMPSQAPILSNQV